MCHSRTACERNFFVFIFAVNIKRILIEQLKISRYIELAELCHVLRNRGGS
jgi:hypothetical protein